MTKNVIPESRNKLYQNQCDLLKENYEVPDVLSTVVSIWMHHVKREEMLDFPDEKTIYTNCEEKVKKRRWAVGKNDRYDGIDIQSSSNDEECGDVCGLSGLRKL